MSYREPLRRWSKNFLLLACSFGFALGGLELTFRAFGLRGYHAPRTRSWSHALVPEADRIPGVTIQFKPRSVFELAYDSNPRGYFNDNNGLVYRMNNLGFRGPHIEMQRTDGVQRVVVLGDSFTLGEGVRLEDTFCARLQAELSSESIPVEVINFGVSAWATQDEIAFYRKTGHRFQPDLTIVVYVINDGDKDHLDFWENFRRRYEKRRLKSSYLASYLYAEIVQRTLAKQYLQSLINKSIEREDSWEQSFELLLEGRAIARKNNGEFLVVLFPFMYELSDKNPFLPIHGLVRDYCSQHKINFMDLLEDFKGRDYRELWVHATDQHPNEVGHKIAAESIARHIQEQKLLQGLPHEQQSNHGR